MLVYGAQWGTAHIYIYIYIYYTIFKSALGTNMFIYNTLIIVCRLHIKCSVNKYKVIYTYYYNCTGEV